MTRPAPTHWIGTDVGLVREHNEDAFLWLGPEETGGGWLWVVADGLGGQAAGDVASALLTTCFEELYEEALAEAGGPPRAIERCAAEANRRILHVGASFPELRGLGTTLLALAVRDGEAWVAHVGDSRCYWLHRGTLTLLTRDHRRAETPIELGHVSRAAAEATPEASLLTRMLGHASVEVDHGSGRPIPLTDDVFLLCSDGVWSVLPEDTIREALSRLHARDAVEALVELARAQWSDDNLTACVVRMAPPEAARAMSRESFLRWASGDVSKLDPGRTMVLQAVPDRSVEERPPRSNVSGIPRIQAAPRPAPAEEPGVVQTQLHSPDRIAQLVAAAGAAASGADDPTATAAFSLDALQAQLAAGAVPSTMAPPLGTSAFSVDAVAVGRGARPPLRTDQVGSVGDSTMAFSPDQVSQLAAAIAGRMAPASTGGFARDVAPPRGNRSTLFFAADDVARAAAPPAAAPGPGVSPAPATPRPAAAGAAPAALPPPARRLPGSGAAASRAAASPALASGPYDLGGEPTSESLELSPRRSTGLALILAGIVFSAAVLGALGYMLLRAPPAPAEAADGSAGP